jgi:hypothetical protein
MLRGNGCVNEKWIKDKWTPVWIDFDKKDAAKAWCYEMLGPDMMFIAPVWAGWMHETHREGTGGPAIEVFFFQRKQDAVAFTLAIGSKEGY